MDNERLAGGYSWQVMYERWLQDAMAGCDKLVADPDFKTAEDLGDFVEAIHTMLTFGPRARDDIRRQVRG